MGRTVGKSSAKLVFCGLITYNIKLINIMLMTFFLVLEVYQFARDAAVAEAWLLAQEPYIMSLELGVSYVVKFIEKMYNAFYLS